MSYSRPACSCQSITSHPPRKPEKEKPTPPSPLQPRQPATKLGSVLPSKAGHRPGRGGAAHAPEGVHTSALPPLLLPTQLGTLAKNLPATPAALNRSRPVPPGGVCVKKGGAWGTRGQLSVRPSAAAGGTGTFWPQPPPPPPPSKKEKPSIPETEPVQPPPCRPPRPIIPS
ncbi:uncharacterized protein B0H64DRAFT_134015 [Chaetomium fimeti]|uniref:Uncharacterized protein n=1 Tax=Chaetomium fimeti TaxID=1854472 RepID=A0AAE0HLL9_9PEZI|nr:hypothetical protein B0H64DRAFT_134015 [Chaetomium fimeti]